MAKKNLTKLYNSYLSSKIKGSSLETSYRYVVYKSAGGKNKK